MVCRIFSVRKPYLSLTSRSCVSSLLMCSAKCLPVLPQSNMLESGSVSYCTLKVQYLEDTSTWALLLRTELKGIISMWKLNRILLPCLSLCNSWFSSQLYFQYFGTFPIILNDLNRNVVQAPCNWWFSSCFHGSWFPFLKNKI